MIPEIENSDLATTTTLPADLNGIAKVHLRFRRSQLLVYCLDVSSAAAGTENRTLLSKHFLQPPGFNGFAFCIIEARCLVMNKAKMRPNPRFDPVTWCLGVQGIKTARVHHKKER